jgi:hypothetical protein
MLDERLERFEQTFPLSAMARAFLDVAVPLFARCSRFLRKSPPDFARPATSFSLLVQRKGLRQKNLWVS